MAEDIKMKYDEDLKEFDMVFSNGDLERELGLETAVLMSIFTDRRASSEDKFLDDLNDKRGWWGDGLNDNDDLIGSKLWMLRRAKTTSEVVITAKKYIEEALQWMIDDKVAASIIVNVTRQDRSGNETTSYDSDVLVCEIKIYKNDETTETFKYNDLWESQIANG